MSMHRLLIIGAGGHGRVVADAAACMNQWTEIAFVDDGYPDKKMSGRWPIIGGQKDLPVLRDRFAYGIVGIGQAALRLNLLDKLIENGFGIPVVCHPASVVAIDAELCKGTVVMAGAVINSGARVGCGSVINTGSSIDHDCIIMEGVHVCPGAHVAGGVTVGARCWIGIGAVIIQACRVGADVTIGAGAAVINDIPDGVTVVGVPARILHQSSCM